MLAKQRICAIDFSHTVVQKLIPHPVKPSGWYVWHTRWRSQFVKMRKRRCSWKTSWFVNTSRSLIMRKSSLKPIILLPFSRHATGWSLVCKCMCLIKDLRLVFLRDTVWFVKRWAVLFVFCLCWKIRSNLLMICLLYLPKSWRRWNKSFFYLMKQQLRISFLNYWQNF